MSGIQEFLQENAETTTTKDEVAPNSVVCTSLMPSPPRRAPWLVFFAHGRQQKLQTFVNLSEERVLVRDVEEMRRVVYYAQVGSWLFMADLSHSGCFLLNLSSRKKIMLPPLPRGSRYISDAMITRSSPPPPQAKGIMIRSSRARPPPVILTYRDDRNVFLFHRVGDVGWEVAKCKVEGGISSLVGCNGKIYALGELWRDLVVVDVDYVVSCPRVITTVLSVERVALPLGTITHHQLLESCGELFLVSMYFMTLTRRFYSFAVYKLESSGDGTMRWVEVDGLGEDRSFFFGTMWFGPQGPGMSCSASAAGITANCIYFVDHNHSAILKFDMADKSVSTVMSWPMVSQPWVSVGWLKLHPSLTI